jgi:hypothetical protein
VTCFLAFVGKLGQNRRLSEMKQTLKILAALVGGALAVNQLPAVFNDLIGKQRWLEFGNPEGLYITEYCEQPFWFAPVKRYALKMENHPEWGYSEDPGPIWVRREELPGNKLGEANEWSGSFEIRPPHIRVGSTGEHQ